MAGGEAHFVNTIESRAIKLALDFDPTASQETAPNGFSFMLAQM